MKNTKFFVPEDFEVPRRLETEKFILEVLSPKYCKLDYDAVVSSKKRLRTIFGEKTEWPKENLSLSDNEKDLQRHETEFNKRKAFAYTVLDLEEKKCLGCVYIEPGKKEDYDCEVYLWVRESDIHLDKKLFYTIKNWIEQTWPFANVAYPGREILWKNWNEIK